MKKHKKSIITLGVFLLAMLTAFIVITTIYSSQEKNFKTNIQQAKEVRITSGSTGEYIVLSKEDAEKLADKVDTFDFKSVLFPKQYSGWSYEIAYKMDDNDWWEMVFGGGCTKISHNNNRKSYQYNHELDEYVEAMYKELGGK